MASLSQNNAGNNTTNDDIEDLQRRLQLLEGERKAHYESTTQNLKQNQEIIRQMKQETIQLRKQISVLRAEGQGQSGDQISQKQSALKSLHKNLNALRAEVTNKQNQMDKALAKLREMEANAAPQGSDNNSDVRQLRVLENRLDKSMIKFNEAMSIRKTYETIVGRLQEERICFDNQLMGVERTLKAKERDYEELLLLSHDAYHAKEMAQAELHRFEQGVMEERLQRDREVQEKKQLVQQRVEMNHRLEAAEKTFKSAKELDSHGHTALQANIVMTDMAAAITNDDYRDQKNCLEDYEDAVRQIKEACGVSDVNEIIQKFLLQEQTEHNLKKLTTENQAKIDGLASACKNKKREVDELRYGNSAAKARTSGDDEVKGHLQEAQRNMETNMNKYKATSDILVNVKAAVQHLYDKLAGVKLIEGEQKIELHDDSVEVFLQQVELKLSHLMSLASVDEVGPGRMGRAIKADSENWEKLCMSRHADNYNKVTTGADDDEDDAADDGDDDAQECRAQALAHKHASDMEAQKQKKAADKAAKKKKR